MSLPARPVIGVLHPGVMGAALGSALKPVAGAVIWAAAGRSVTTSKRAEIAELIGVLPDFEEAKVMVSGTKRPINLLRANIQRGVKVLLIDSKRVGPAEAAAALLSAYEDERVSIDLAVQALRS